jgi:hypothetical protein
MGVAAYSRKGYIRKTKKRGLYYRLSLLDAHSVLTAPSAV